MSCVNLQQTRVKNKRERKGRGQWASMFAILPIYIEREITLVFKEIYILWYVTTDHISEKELQQLRPINHKVDVGRLDKDVARLHCHKYLRQVNNWSIGKFHWTMNVQSLFITHKFTWLKPHTTFFQNKHRCAFVTCPNPWFICLFILQFRQWAMV